MTERRTDIPLQTLHLFPTLHRLLIELLHSLTPGDWQRPTIAKLWTVKDISAHLLDGDIRGLSTSRDGFFGEQPGAINSHTDLVDFLNVLNATWTRAARRISPTLLIDLIEHAGTRYIDHLNTLDPFADAIFPVGWAGQDVSPNWFHIAREYTEKFLHQQQIREAVGQQALLTRELFFPFIDTFMYALPHTYRNVAAPEGTTIRISITTEIGGHWHLVRKGEAWLLGRSTKQPDASITIEPGDAWKLFSKSMRPEEARSRVIIEGDAALAGKALGMVSVMA